MDKYSPHIDARIQPRKSTMAMKVCKGTRPNGMRCFAPANTTGFCVNCRRRMAKDAV